MGENHNSSGLNDYVAVNFKKVTLKSLIVPAIFLAVIVCTLVEEKCFSVAGYINIQKGIFFQLNKILSGTPVLQDNLTQLGDVVIFFPLVTIFIIYAPKFWEALLTSAIISLVVSAVLKRIFAVPRPAAVFDHNDFTIVGETLSGHTSLPSGHSIAAFVVITTLLLAFAPRYNRYARMVWFVFILTVGAFITFSRVGVGAHYPLDVIIGSIIGFMIAVSGIAICNKYSWCAWIRNKKYLPFLWCFL